MKDFAKTIVFVALAFITGFFFCCFVPFMLLFALLRHVVNWIINFFKPRDPTDNSGCALFIDDSYLFQLLN